MTEQFTEPEERQIIERFLNDGYIVFDIDEPETLNEIKRKLFNYGSSILDCEDKPEFDEFFDSFGNYMTVEALNNFRVKMISHIAQDPEMRPAIYQLTKKYIDIIVGNELSMQNKCNLSIQLPNDDSSLLPLHADVWSGNSPYEVVFWLPLVDCFRTKSMFILAKQDTDNVYADFQKYSLLTSEELYREIEDKLIWLEVKYGKAIIFSHYLIHGNRVNVENETRWSFNVRFKSLLSPYGSKGLGESFLPITIRPATRIGYEYQKPTIK